MLTTSARSCVAVIAGASLAIGGALVATVPAVAAAGTLYYVEASGDDTTGDGSSTAPFATIAKAAQSAVDGDSINVGAGAFAGTTLTHDIDLVGNGSTTELTGTLILSPGAEGATVSGLHFTGDDNQIWLNSLDGSKTTTIDSNLFDMPTNPPQPNSILDSVASGILITDNTFVGDGTFGDAVSVNFIGGSAGLDDVVVTRNTSTGYGNFVVANANEVGGMSGLVVSDNVARATVGTAVFIGDALDDVQVTGNLIEGGGSSAVGLSSFTGSAALGGAHDVAINGNTFVKNVRGISVIDGMITSTLDATGNAFLGNTNGVRNNSASTVDASGSVWSTPAGPVGSGLDSSTGTGTTTVTPVAASLGTEYAGATSTTLGLTTTVALGASAANKWFAVGGYGAPATFRYAKASAAGKLAVTWPSGTTGAQKVAIVPAGFASRQYVDVTVSALPSVTGTLYYVEADGSDSNNGSDSAPFATLNAAVHAAHDGDGILVGAGSFAGSGVNKDVDIIGNGSTSEISSQLTLGAGSEGATVTGLHFTSHDNQIWAVGLDGSETTTIEHNLFDMPTAAGQPNSVLNSIANGLSVLDNTFVGDGSNGNAVAVNFIGGVEGIEDSLVSGNTATGYGNFVVANANAAGGMSGLEVSDNVVRNTVGTAVFIGDALDDVQVTDNVISGGGSSAVGLSSFTGTASLGGAHDVTIHGNTFVKNVRAISVIDGMITSTLDASGNAFFGNTNGVRNNSASTVDVSGSIWSRTAGPLGSGLDSSTGTGVTNVLPVAASLGITRAGAGSSTSGLVTTLHLGASAANKSFTIGGYGLPATFAVKTADASGDVLVTWPDGTASGAVKVAVLSGGFATREFLDITIPPAAFTSAPVPSISGHATVGRTLTAITRTWTPAATLSLQWNADGVAIPGATGNSLVLTPAQFGKKITLSVSAAVSGSGTVTKTSVPTVAVTAAPFVSAPIPAVTGSRTVGATLTAVPGTWNPAATLVYHWARDGKIIAGATSSTYTQVAADKNHRIQVIVTASATGYVTKSVRSATPSKTGAVLVSLPTSVSIPQPVPARVGVRLGVSTTGNWQSGAKLTYQWRADGVAIKGATNATYVPVAANIGKVITVTVYGAKSGYTTNRISSAPTSAVLIGTYLSAQTPLVSAPRVGKTSTAVVGTWNPQPTVVRYQWSLDGTPIVGATKSTYTPAPSAVGKTLTVSVTGIRSGYTNVMVTSIGKVVAAAPFTKTVAPKISGTAKVGRVLTATTSAWTPAATALSYQWKLNGVAIAGAVDDIYTVASEDLGGRLTVTVTATRLGYTTTSMTSSSTAVVTP